MSKLLANLIGIALFLALASLAALFGVAAAHVIYWSLT